MRDNMKKVKLYGMEWQIFAFFAVVILISLWLGIIPNQLVGGIAVMFTLGIIFSELGERIPIWNLHCGGGAILAFIGWLPESGIAISKGWMNDYGFLNLFICFLVVGSLLGLDRDMLIKSSVLYIPAIFASLAGAAVFGIFGGAVFGKSPAEILTAYVLPIMGGGAGAGAVPMAQVYHDVTGLDSSGYLSFALAILAVGNIISVAFAVILNVIGMFVPRLTGNGQLVRTGKGGVSVEEKKLVAPTMDDVAAGIFLTAGFFVLAQFVSKKVLPSIFGVAIPNFAYLIIFAALANVFKLIPDNLKSGCQRCQQFCSSKMIWIQMAGCGITLINFNEMLGVLSWSNLTIAFLIVLGCVIGSGIFGALVGFYPVESAITAGLCMAHRGGAGDLAVLGAAKRMDLMSYAQISSRIGGAIVLLLGSLVFQFIG